MENSKKPTFRCRNCKIELKGSGPHYLVHPRTGERCRENFFGGAVCSKECDIEAVRAMELSMPGGGYSRNISLNRQQEINRKWDEVS